MTTAVDLIEHGYFPREVVPAFYTERLARRLGAIKASIPIGNRVTLGSPYSIPGPNNGRRFLSLPNPQSQIKLCDFIEQHWTQIETHYAKSAISLSRPSPDPSRPRAVSTRIKFKDLSRKQLLSFPESSFVLHADTSRYYTSIYTHSIPWAIHGKDVAKKDHTDRLWGNTLDTLVRNTQHGQTKGIHTGPDTSLIISEIIGTTIDCAIVDALGHTDLKGNRFLDDYFLYFSSEADATRARAAIEQALREFDLELNAGKSKVVRLPESTESEWESALRGFDLLPFYGDDDIKIGRLCTFFNMAFREAAKAPAERVIREALKQIGSLHISAQAWPTLEALLLRSVMSDPSALPIATKIFVQHRDRDIDIERIGSVLCALIRHHAPLTNSHEVAWALWTMKVLEITVPEVIANDVAAMDDSVCALVLLDLRDNGLTEGTVDESKWVSFLNIDELGKRNWLLAYEASVRGWLRRADKQDFVKGDQFFSALRKFDVTFYDPDIEPEPRSSRAAATASPSEVDRRHYESNDESDY